jgi:hypothetical protein
VALYPSGGVDSVITRIVLAAVFVALIAWDVWEAVGNLLGLPAYYSALGFAESTPWVLLIPGVVIPVLVWGLGLWWGWRRRSPIEAAVVYAVLLSVQATLSLSLIAAEQAWRADVLIAMLG